jgi:parallel beta-helix repeat protein
MTRLAIILMITLVVVLVTGVNATARTWYILPDGSGDAPTIQAGIDSATAGDAVLLANGTYAGDGNREIYFNGKAITVRSESGDPSLCIIDCQGNPTSEHSGFHFVSGESSESVLKGITVTNAYYSQWGGVFCFGSSPTLADCIFSGNVAMLGSGMLCASNSSPVLTNCTFVDNTASNGGGGVLCNGSSPRFMNCTFSDNVSPQGGAMNCYESSPTLADCIFSGNVAQNYGGGIYCSNNSSPTLTNCTFSHNEAQTCGGGVYSTNSSSPTLTNCTFSGNRGGILGGGMFCIYSSITLTGCTFSGNEANLGGGIYTNNSSTTLGNTIVAFNIGDAVHCISSSVSLTCCDIYGNSGVDWVDCIADQHGINGNFSADPLFCAPGSGDVRLSCTSPCVDRYGCGQIGAFGVGCGPTAVQNTTWGRIKSMFR